MSARANALSMPVDDTAIEKLVDEAIAAAPDCLRRRIILPAIDWSEVSPSKVAVLLSTLAQSRLAVPRWLSKLLLLAGHALPEDVEPTLTPGLVALNRINCAGGASQQREALSGMLPGLCADEQLEGDVATILVQKFAALGWDAEAARLALAQQHRVPGILKRVGKALGAHIERLPNVRLRLTGSSTTQTLADEFKPAFAAKGWRADVMQADFGTMLADLMRPAEDADAHIVLLDLEGFAAQDWRRPAADAFALLTERANNLAAALREFSTRSQAPLLINTIPVPAAPTAGFLDRSHTMGLRRAVDLINRHILDTADQSNHIIVIDADQALADLPVREQSDSKLWYYGRIAYSADAARMLARAFADAWSVLKCGPAKVLAVDFDNTLWGGVYGDDGVEALACGEDFPGNAFRALQAECLRLRQQGLLLVALSKNNPDAITAFQRHAGMLLQPDDFAASAINWEPKPENIRRVAAELNLGLESFVFLDDSPHEREAMRRLCPEVSVPEMPADPAERPLWLRRLTSTWPLRLTAEDETRAALYAARREAQNAKAGAVNFEDYLNGLEQRLAVSLVSKKTLPRVVQMHQRTNQFNLTTLRSTEADISALIESEARGMALVGRVRDKFGDHGLVVTATVEITGTEAVVQSLLMSCRVIGREIERAFLGALIEELKRRGVTRVSGDYIATRKNAMVKDFYASCGWQPAGGDEARSGWVFNIGDMESPQSRFVALDWEA
ncbi:HAD-IIIC family phosphatase [Hyphomicrobium denitrificans]|nr:HAD-IIIC family phosphatase [Hyphomicrobium denitrificans]